MNEQPLDSWLRDVDYWLLRDFGSRRVVGTAEEWRLLHLKGLSPKEASEEWAKSQDVLEN